MSKMPTLIRKRISEFAAYAKTATIQEPLNFYAITNASGAEIVFRDMYPPLHAAGAIDYFFFAMVHNYGFWTDDGEKYVSPLFGKWKEKTGVKGSDLLWKMLCAAWQKDNACLAPERLATISDTDFAAMFSDDDGPVELFMTPERLDLTRNYGKWFRTPRWWGVRSPSELVSYANDYEDAVHVLREILTHPENGVPAFREDPLGKKAELLLMALANRPEKYLRRGINEGWRPIVDYHDMRLTLRLGHVTLPKEWADENTARKITTHEREEAIRNATYKADALLIKESGRTRDEIDILKWSARTFCPEMVTPNCSACLFQDVCAKRVLLFQPVLRTTHY